MKVECVCPRSAKALLDQVPSTSFDSELPLPTFELMPAIVVNIDCEPGDDIVQRFLRFCLNEKIYSLCMGSVGPSGLVRCYRAEDADVIGAWLRGNEKIKESE